jgi:hypothetical protein
MKLIHEFEEMPADRRPKDGALPTRDDRQASGTNRLPREFQTCPNNKQGVNDA